MFCLQLLQLIFRRATDYGRWCTAGSLKWAAELFAEFQRTKGTMIWRRIMPFRLSEFEAVKFSCSFQVSYSNCADAIFDTAVVQDGATYDRAQLYTSIVIAVGTMSFCFLVTTVSLIRCSMKLKNGRLWISSIMRWCHGLSIEITWQRFSTHDMYSW
jgi:hypothetical protein